MDHASQSSRPAVRSVLVFGASGFVGRRVVRALREAGLAVTAGDSRTHDFQRDLTPEAWLPPERSRTGCFNEGVRTLRRST